jgi:hypothetical protein
MDGDSWWYGMHLLVVVSIFVGYRISSSMDVPRRCVTIVVLKNIADIRRTGAIGNLPCRYLYYGTAQSPVEGIGRFTTLETF